MQRLLEASQQHVTTCDRRRRHHTPLRAAEQPQPPRNAPRPHVPRLEPLARLGLLEQGLQGAPESLDIARTDEHGRLFVAQELREPADLRRYDGAAERHRLEGTCRTFRARARGRSSRCPMYCLQRDIMGLRTENLHVRPLRIEAGGVRPPEYDQRRGCRSCECASSRTSIPLSGVASPTYSKKSSGSPTSETAFAARRTSSLVTKFGITRKGTRGESSRRLVRATVSLTGRNISTVLRRARLPAVLIATNPAPRSSPCS